MPNQKISADPELALPSAQARLAGIDIGTDPTKNYRFAPSGTKKWLDIQSTDIIDFVAAVQGVGGAGFPRSASVPTTGSYNVGDIVFNSNQDGSSGKQVIFWFRKTSGNTHNLGVDWVEVYGLSKPDILADQNGNPILTENGDVISLSQFGKLSDLAAIISFDPSDLLLVEQGGVLRKVTFLNLVNAIRDAL